MKKHVTAVVILICVLFAIICVTHWPERRRWTYTLNGRQVNYEIGEEVEWNGKTFRCIKWDASDMGVIIPPEANPDWWAEID